MQQYFHNYNYFIKICQQMRKNEKQQLQDNLNKSQIVFRQAVEKHEKRNYQQAIKLYIKSIQLNPKKASSYFNLALVYKDTRKYAQAIKCLQQAIKVDPNYTEAYINLGNIYKKAKKFTQAQKCYKAALQKDSHHLGALTNLGLLYKQLKNFALAQEIFRKIVQKYPKNARALNSLGVILKNGKQQNQALLCWQKAIKLDPKMAETYYNIGSYQASISKFKDAEENLKIADQLKPNDPIILIMRAVNLSKSKLHDQAWQIVEKLNEIYAKQELQSIAKRTNLTSGNLKWIKSSLYELQMLQKLNKQQMRMSLKQKQVLKEINNDYMISMVDAEDNEGQNQNQISIKQRLQKLQKQIKEQTQQIIIVHNKIGKLENDVNNIKAEFQWDQKFDQLLSSQPKRAAYYRSLYIILSTSIQAYRAVQTGIVSGGPQIIKSKVGGFIQKICSILKIAESIPMVSHFCQAVVQLGELYIQIQAKHVVSQIILATNSLYNQKKISKATCETILYLSQSEQFAKLLLESQKIQDIWYNALFKKAKQLQAKMVEKISSLGGHSNIQDQMNMAMGHCAQILLKMITLKNSQIVSSSNNPLLISAQIWLKQTQMLNLSILGAALQYKEGFFAKKINPYCKITYNTQQFQTEVQKNFGKTPSWSESTFKLDSYRSNTKKLEQKQIKFQIFDRSIFKKDQLIGTGIVADNITKFIKHSIELYDSNNVQVGYLEIIIE